MIDIQDLQELQLDALREVASIGAGHAATALSQMTASRIMISVPRLQIARLEETSRRLDPSMDKLDTAIGEANVTLKKYGKVADSADAFINGEGLAQLSELIADMRRLSGNLNRFSEQLNRQPSTVIFGDRRKGYTPP